MKIVLFAPGSRGDVQPYVALGKGLLLAGHEVVVVTSEDFAGMVQEQGLRCEMIQGSSETAARTQMKDIVESGNLLKILAATGRGAQQLAEDSARAGLAACRDADLLIGGFGGLNLGLALSEKLGVPYLQAYLVPFTPTRYLPSALAPLPQTPVTRFANKLSHRMTQQMMWQMLRRTDARVRREILTLPPAAFGGPFRKLEQERQPVLYGYSSHVLPKPPDWHETIHPTGYWFLEPEANWTPPVELTAFLKAGPPPVYIGFGSMASRQPAETAELVLQALARTGQRGVLYSGWGGLQPNDLPDTVFLTGSIPHSWLLPRMAATVHHGGAGTTAAGFRAGVPSVVTPFFGDQPFWGRRVYDLGVGPKPIPRRRLTVDNLAAAINTAVTDQSMRHRARELGQKIEAEDGVATAVAYIEHYFQPAASRIRAST